MGPPRRYSTALSAASDACDWIDTGVLGVMVMQQCQHLHDRCKLCLAEGGIIVAHHRPAAVLESQAGAA